MNKIYVTALATLAMVAVAATATALPATDVLQAAFDERTENGPSSIDVYNDMLDDTTDSYWNITATGASISVLMFEFAGYKENNQFGIYDVNDPTNRLEIFNGGDSAGHKTTLEINVGTTGGYEFSTYDKFGGLLQATFSSQTFGYYMNNQPGDDFYSDTALNVDGVDHLFAYQGVGDSFDATLNGIFADWTPCEYVLAWEDLYGGGDLDFTDMVIMVESVQPVPEPATMLLFGTGLVGLVTLRKRNAKK